MPLDVLHSDLSREAGADSVGSGETHNKRRSYKRMRGQICAVMVFALYVLVGLTRPLVALHSDLSREARADLVEKSFWRKHNKINSDQKQKHENTKRIQKTKTTNDINENKFRNKRKHAKQNHDNNNMVPAAKNVLLRCLQ